MPQPLHTTPQGLTQTLRRFGPDLWFFAGLVILFNLHLVGLGSPFAWIFFPQEVQNGQWWRLLTHPFVHLTFYHLALDAGAFFILYAGLTETRLSRKLSYVGVAGFASMAAALALSPDFDRLGLCGLSGIAHGLMAVSGLEMMADTRHRIAGWLSFAAVAVKSVIETFNGEVLFEFLHMGLCGKPLAACHLGGVAGASVLFLLFWAADRRKNARGSAGLHRVARVVARVFYRLRIRGAEHFPENGPAVIVANHVSYLDPVLIAAACPRPIRFVMHAPYFRLPVLHHFFRAVGAIPISSARSDPGALRRALHQVREALENGELVCIFPEGRLTRNGDIGPFRPGIERIVRRTPVPVVPVAIAGMWGSVSSYRWGPPLKKRPRRFRSRVTVTLFEPVAPADAAASRLRRLVSEGSGSPDIACDRRRSVTTSSGGQHAWSPIGKAADCFERRC
jgi:rhomboid family GlyGly-CTERM serine protease